jgi:hypothetical protein
MILNPYSCLPALKAGVAPYAGDSREMLSLLRNAIANMNIARSALPRLDQKARLRLKLVATIPTCSCVFSETMMDIAFYDELKKGNRLPSWRFEKVSEANQSATLYGYYSDNFDVIWSRADSIDYYAARCAALAEGVGEAQTAKVQEFKALVKASAGLFDFGV